MLEVVQKSGRPGAKRKFPWDEMEAGDEFVVWGRTATDFTGTLAYANQSRHPKRFTAKTILGGVNVRRVK